MMNYRLAKIQKEIAKEMIVKNHYSHCWTMCHVAIGIYEKGETHPFFSVEGENTTNDKLIGCLVYGNPVGRQVYPSISPLIKQGEVLELTRLWIKDGTPKNTESWAIAQSFEWLKKNEPQIKMLISYADPVAGHLGKIYQATNWLYQFIQTSEPFKISFCGPPNYEWLHLRTVVAKNGTRELTKLPRPLWIKQELTKHRYLYFLCDKTEKKKLIKSLVHPVTGYPKELKQGQGITELTTETDAKTLMDLHLVSYNESEE